jgi:hypothetical protein
MMLEPELEEVVEEFPCRMCRRFAGELHSDQGRLAISTELSAANSHSIASLRPRGSAGISAVAALAEVKQDRAALEDRDVAVGQPRHLAEGLVREMLGVAIAERHALDAIGQPGLFQRPAHAQVAHKAPRHLGNPVEGGEDQLGHSQLWRQAYGFFLNMKPACFDTSYLCLRGSWLPTCGPAQGRSCLHLDADPISHESGGRRNGRNCQQAFELSDIEQHHSGRRSSYIVDA